MHGVFESSPSKKNDNSIVHSSVARGVLERVPRCPQKSVSTHRLLLSVIKTFLPACLFCTNSDDFVDKMAKQHGICVVLKML